MTRTAGGLSAGWIRRGLVSSAAMVALGGMTAGPAVADTGATAIRPATTTWSAAQEIPGTAALNKQYAGIQHALSCASAGNCSVGGYYTDAAGHDQAFVDNETSGTWGTAQEVPGLAKLNVYDAQMFTLSCKTAGNCSAGGDYTDSLRHSQSFVAREKDGTWLAAKEVPGTAALNAGGTSELVSLSCTAAAACSGGGAYIDSSHDEQAYVVSETGGTWGTAKEVPGLAALNTGGDAYVTSVSCVSAGNCTAGGYYVNSAGDQEAFVVTQSGGTWGNAQEVPGIGTLNDQQGPLESLSCGSAGNCAAVGSYTDSAGNIQAWLATETGGTWGSAAEIPGTAALNSDGFAVADTVSCKSAGNCSAGGWYTGSQIQAFVVTETGGTWGSAAEVPGTSTLNTSGNAQLWTVSCASAGNCTAGGYYWNDSEGGQEAFVVSQSKGTWGKAEEVPGTEALNVNGGGVTQMISCPTAAHCAVAGEYGVSSGDLEVFVASQT
jgi:hypothetical protein